MVQKQQQQEQQRKEQQRPKDPATSLPRWKETFLEQCKRHNVLQFGTYTLKSNRISPYFFNAGLFHRADLLRSLAEAYAKTIVEGWTTSSSSSSKTIDVIYGPAYKGIPLAVATTLALAELDDARFGQVAYAFDRKEVKDHGEGGHIVGCPLRGKRVIIVDDVITAGTAIRGAIDLVQREAGQLLAIVVALDRMETTASVDGETSRQSAIGRLREQCQVPVYAVLTLDDIIQDLMDDGSEDDVQRLREYRRVYGVDDHRS